LSDTLGKIICGNVRAGTYNLVDKNLQILELVDVLKEIYPSLEFLFTNQHMNLRELKINPESSLFEQIAPFKSKDLKSELIEFKERFAF